MATLPYELQILLFRDSWDWAWEHHSLIDQRLVGLCTLALSRANHSMNHVAKPAQSGPRRHTWLVERQRHLLSHELRLWREYQARLDLGV